jgi:hypothetical protein
MWKKVKIAAAKNVLGELVISQDNETLIFVEDDADAAAQLELLEKKKMQRAKWRSAIGKIGQMQSSVAAWQTKLEDDAQVNRAVSAVMINMALKVMADTATTACVSPHCRPEPACLPPRRSLSAARDQLQQPARRPNTRAAACCACLPAERTACGRSFCWTRTAATPPQRPLPLRPCRACAVGKRVFLRCHFILQMITLPRQAREKHSKTTLKKTRFCRCRGAAHQPDGGQVRVRRNCNATLFECFPYVCPEPVLVK